MSSLAKAVKSSETKPVVRFDLTKVRQRGHKLKLVGFPEIPPEFPERFRLIALIAGNNWGYGIDVTERADYAELLQQWREIGSNIQSVELYSLHDGRLSECALS